MLYCNSCDYKPIFVKDNLNVLSVSFIINNFIVVKFDLLEKSIYHKILYDYSCFTLLPIPWFEPDLLSINNTLININKFLLFL